MCIVLTVTSHSFHNKLKTNPRYLNHNVNRRCDDLIAVLMSVEVDMFYERKRKEVFTSITEASMKVEGNRHALGLKIMDLKVHVQVMIIYSAHVQQHLITYYRRKKTCILWIQVIQKTNTLWTYCHLHVHKNPTACHTVWKRSALTCADTWCLVPAMIFSMVTCVSIPIKYTICIDVSNLHEMRYHLCWMTPICWQIAQKMNPQFKLVYNP